MSRPLVFAHRGASANAIENTLEAFELAIDMQADGLELDLQLTKDKVPIVVHDLNLHRLTGKRVFVQNLTVDEIKKLRVGKMFVRRYRGARILTFDEFLEWHAKRPVPLNVELKETFIENDEALKYVVKKCISIRDLHISSFHIELLKKVKNVTSSIETALIATKFLNWDQLDQLPYIDTIHANKSRYYKEHYLEACMRQGRNCRFYNITGNEKYIESPHNAVIGWITDYPQSVRNAQERHVFDDK
ncbi:glycerophosphodiester phosphodiesterase [Rummeliibacillus sp. JY-2-4R]